MIRGMSVVYVEVEVVGVGGGMVVGDSYVFRW